MGSPGKFRRQLDKKDEETILRYVDNYLGYKKSYLRRERASSFWRSALGWLRKDFLYKGAGNRLDAVFA